MQTFLPYPSFSSSAKVIDKKRCWKQVVEAKQIIEVLCKYEEASNQYSDKDEFTRFVKTLPWVNHPAVKMWKGHVPWLMYYFDCFLEECIKTHKINTKLKPYNKPLGNSTPPWWYANGDFHRSHRARLVAKDKTFYLPMFPGDENFNNGKYFWPDMETKTFKII